MADKFLTLLDQAKFDGSDAAIGLIDLVNTHAPEIADLSGRGINGVTYKVTKKTANPAGPAFRNVNEGSDIISGSYEQSIGQCFFMDGQMRVDEAIVKNGIAEGGSFGGILSLEAANVMQQKAINIGNQFYNGTSADAKGFVGLLASYDATNCLVKAGGTTASSQTSAWLVWNDPKGVHWVFGNNTSIEVGQWTKQQVTDSNAKAFMAWVNNASGYLGLAFGHTRSAVRIANCEDAANKRLTPIKIREALTKIPQFMKKGGGLRLFMNENAYFQLWQSITVVNVSGTQSGPIQFDEQEKRPSIFGIPISITDSITNTEAVVA